MTDRIFDWTFLVLNTAAALVNLYIGGWNLIVVPLSYTVALISAWQLGRNS